MIKRRRILILLGISVIVIAFALQQLSHAHDTGSHAIRLPENQIVHQPGSLPAFRKFIRESEQVKNDSLIRIAVFSTSRKSDSLTHCIVHSLRTLYDDPRLSMQATWSSNWELNALMRTNGIFNRPVGIYKDTSGDNAVQYREAWVHFSLLQYDRPWQLTVLEKNNPFASDFIFSRDTTVLQTIHQDNTYGWKQIGYTSRRNNCSLVLASEISPEIGAIQPEPLTGFSTWMVHTPDFQSKGSVDETKQQLTLLRPALCIFSIDKNDVAGLTQLEHMLRIMDKTIPVIVITTSPRNLLVGSNRAAFLRVNTAEKSMKEILRSIFLPGNACPSVAAWTAQWRAVNPVK